MSRVHVHLTVTDLARSEAFYAAFLGAEPVKQMPGYTKFLPSWGPLNLAIREEFPKAKAIAPLLRTPVCINTVTKELYLGN